MSDAQIYRTKEEIEEYKKIDPITQILDVIKKKKYATDAEIEKIDAIEQSINKNENIFTLHRDYLNKKVYKKSIDGNLLVLSNENIININFTYVKTSNKVKYWKGHFYDFLVILYLITIVGLVIFPFLQIKYTYFEPIWNKIVFSLTTSLVLIILLNMVRELLKIKNSETKTSFKDFGFTIILLSTPYLWVFGILSGLFTFFTFFIILFIFAAMQNNNKRIRCSGYKNIINICK